jgi:hypothetical protein
MRPCVPNGHRSARYSSSAAADLCSPSTLDPFTQVDIFSFGVILMEVFAKSVTGAALLTVGDMEECEMYAWKVRPLLPAAGSNVVGTPTNVPTLPRSHLLRHSRMIAASIRFLSFLRLHAPAGSLVGQRILWNVRNQPADLPSSGGWSSSSGRACSGH